MMCFSSLFIFVGLATLSVACSFFPKTTRIGSLIFKHQRPRCVPTQTFLFSSNKNEQSQPEESNTNTITWVLENNVFSSPDPIRAAAEAVGHRVVDWDDDWWFRASLPRFQAPVVFHGSLGDADRIAREAKAHWQPGAWCRTEKFFCSEWYPNAAPWLLHQKWQATTAAGLVADQDRILNSLGCDDAVFVRPDSPLKPFSGRVLHRDNISLKAMDFGFYFEDEDLPVIVAPVREVGREWRFVVVRGKVVTGSGYQAVGRVAQPQTPMADAWQFAEEIAARLPQPEDVYVVDICESGDSLYLLELNPFSGADLYGCSGDDLVAAVAALILGEQKLAKK